MIFMFTGYDDRRPHRDHSWEGRSGSMDRERYMHSHKEWDNEDYRGPGDWGRERHWPMHDSQVIFKLEASSMFIQYLKSPY